jgi:hypothetical protein
MVIAEKEMVSTRRVEFRIERMPIKDHPEAHFTELLDRFNEMGKQGWRVVSVDLTHHPSYSPAAQPAIPLPVLLEKEIASARRVEYRIERMPIKEHPEAHLSELLERLTEMGKQGWRVVSVDLTHHPSYSPAAQPTIPLPVLLEREI